LFSLQGTSYIQGQNNKTIKQENYDFSIDQSKQEETMMSNNFYSFFGLVVCCALVTKQIIGSTQMSYTVRRESTLAVVPDSIILKKTHNATNAVVVPDSIILKKTQNNATNATLWEASTVLPEWMKDYFDWHQDQLANHLNKEKWQSHRYLVLRCLESEVCGGASDRLSSIPKYIRVASKSKRLLFIKWTRPAPLEEFLVPPGK
jgi:hypothetical protein